MLVVGWDLDNEHSWLTLPVLIWKRQKKQTKITCQPCRVSLWSVFSCLNIFFSVVKTWVNTVQYTQKKCSSSCDLCCARFMCFAVRVRKSSWFRDTRPWSHIMSKAPPIRSNPEELKRRAVSIHKEVEKELWDWHCKPQNWWYFKGWKIQIQYLFKYLYYLKIGS